MQHCMKMIEDVLIMHLVSGHGKCEHYVHVQSESYLLVIRCMMFIM